MLLSSLGPLMQPWQPQLMEVSVNNLVPVDSWMRRPLQSFFKLSSKHKLHNSPRSSNKLNLPQFRLLLLKPLPPLLDNHSHNCNSNTPLKALLSSSVRFLLRLLSSLVRLRSPQWFPSLRCPPCWLSNRSHLRLLKLGLPLLKLRPFPRAPDKPTALLRRLVFLQLPPRLLPLAKMRSLS